HPLGVNVRRWVTPHQCRHQWGVGSLCGLTHLGHVPGAVVSLPSGRSDSVGSRHPMATRRRRDGRPRRGRDHGWRNGTMRIDYRFKIGLLIALLGLLTLSANPQFLAMAQDEAATPDAAPAAPADDPTPPPPPPDTTPPVVDGHEDVFAAAVDASGAVVEYGYPGASDDTDGTDPVDCAPPSGAVFAIGSTVVTCSAGDAAGNWGQSSFTVT